MVQTQGSQDPSTPLGPPPGRAGFLHANPWYLAARQPALHPYFKQADKLRVHEIVFIWNVEHYQPLVLKRCTVLLLELVAMGALHHENEVCPRDQLVGKRLFGVAVSPRRQGDDARCICKDVFSCRATQLVLAAHK